MGETGTGENNVILPLMLPLMKISRYVIRGGRLMGHVSEETWLQSLLSQNRQTAAVPVGTGSIQGS